MYCTQTNICFNSISHKLFEVLSYIRFLKLGSLASSVRKVAQYSKCVQVFRVPFNPLTEGFSVYPEAGAMLADRKHTLGVAT